MSLLYYVVNVFILSFDRVWFGFVLSGQTLDLQRGCLRTKNARAKIVNLREIQIESL